MDLTNIIRSFGSDTLLVMVPAVPALVLFVLLRTRALRRGGAGAPTSAAVAEALLIGYVAAVAAVTMIPQGYGSEHTQRFEWSIWTSDLTYAPDRTQAIANGVMLMPLVALALLRFWSRRPLRAGFSLSLALPAAIELAQGSVIPGRVAALEDVLVGCTGGLVATVATALLLSQWRRRSADPRAASSGTSGDDNLEYAHRIGDFGHGESPHPPPTRGSGDVGPTNLPTAPSLPSGESSPSAQSPRRPGHLT